MSITNEEFLKLPKEEQNFRWACFLATNGHGGPLPDDEVEFFRNKFLVNKEPLPEPMVIYKLIKELKSKRK